MTTGSHDQSALAGPGGEAQPEWTPDDLVEPPEQALLDYALAGKRLDLARGGSLDHQTMTDWGSARTVRAPVLRHLLVDPQWPVHSKGVRLRGARISGRLDLESATVRCPLVLEDCYLENPEPVVLDYATIPRLVLSRCRVVGGLTADLLVTKEIALDESTFEGELSLNGAAITGTLTCHGATFTNPHGNALDAKGMKVGGHVLLDQEFTADGGVRLNDADITGTLACHGATLSNPGGRALDAKGMKVGGDVLLEQRFRAAGAVSIASARIGGSVSLVDAQLAEPVALWANGVHVGGQLVWAPHSPVRGLVDLEQGAVHRLNDDLSVLETSWPPAGQLRLAGFTYDEFGEPHQVSWRQRLDWIRRSHTTANGRSFAVQPYEQLAHVYREAGMETAAREVAIAQRNDLRRYGSLTRSQRVSNWLLDKTMRHGYQPLRALGLLAVVVAVLLVLVWQSGRPASVVVSPTTTQQLPATTATARPSPLYQPVLNNVVTGVVPVVTAALARPLAELAATVAATPGDLKQLALDNAVAPFVKSGSTKLGEAVGDAIARRIGLRPSAQPARPTREATSQVQAGLEKALEDELRSRRKSSQ
jgi:hypothetical protein